MIKNKNTKERAINGKRNEYKFNDIRNLSIINSESFENIQKFSNSKKEMKGK